MTSSVNPVLYNWNLTQGHILTGGGKLDKFSVPNKHFQPSDLPHYLLSNKITRKKFKQWKQEKRTSTSIVGAWSRPLFSGGWSESTHHDTSAYNLQTPSIFIDMRVPTLRPDALLKRHNNLNSCTNEELRSLARQHCFGGYSFPESNKPSKSSTDIQSLTFTRHHVIDWNFHPSFPRSRPNRWFVEVKDMPAQDSFKEHSTIRDEFNIPVYFERWQRREPLIGQQTKYLAMRRQTLCPLLKQQRQFSGDDRDAILVVVGNHFILTVDREYKNILAHMQQHMNNTTTHDCKGSGPLFVDYLLSHSDVITITDDGDEVCNRDIAIDYLELEGSYGLVYADDNVKDVVSTIHSSASDEGNQTQNVFSGSGTSRVRKPSWQILKSTLPWKEGSAAVRSGDVSIQFNSNSNSRYRDRGSTDESFIDSVIWHTVNNNSTASASQQRFKSHNNRPTAFINNVTSPTSVVSTATANTKIRGDSHTNYCDGQWEVLECSFTRIELEAMFGLGDVSPRSRL